LHVGQDDLADLVLARIVLLDRHAFVEGLDRHVLFKMGAALIDEGDDGGVEIVLDGEHGASVARVAGRLNGSALPPGARPGTVA